MTENHGIYDDIYDNLNSTQSTGKTVSPSAINTGLQCRRRYWFRYIMGWKMQAHGAALTLGSSFHAAAEKLNREQSLGHKISLEMMFKEFDAFWQEDVKSLIVGENVNTEKEISDSYEMGLGLLEKYWNSQGRKQMRPMLYSPAGAPSIEIPAVEMKIDIPIVDLKTGRELNKDWRLIGYIDVIKRVEMGSSNGKTKKGDLCVIDYKTTAREFSDFKLDTLIQLLLYSYAIRYILRYENLFPNIKNDKEDHVGIVELLKRKTASYQHARTKLIKVSDAQIEMIQKFIVDFIRSLDDGIFLPNFGDHCGWCDYKEPCVGMMKGKDPEEWWEKIGKYKRAGSSRKVVS